MTTILKCLLYLWQLPQNLIAVGMLIFLGIDSFNTIEDVVYYVSGRMHGGISLGEYIILSESASAKPITIRHEWGHVRQSRMLGWFYLIVIGIPSLVHACFKHDDYYSFYTEKWADELAGITRDENGNRIINA